MVWRRRVCATCEAIFTTRETPDLLLALRVKNDNGTLEPFQRDKLLVSLYSSLDHRKTALRDASGLIETVVAKLLSQAGHGIITTEIIRKKADHVLTSFDSAAATHYRAHHQPTTA